MKPVEWSPDQYKDTSTLQEIMKDFVGLTQEDIPLIIRLIENPSSPFALPGAVDLFNHDCIHAVLRRGLSPQDEAFVIGFTMGSDQAFKPIHGLLFKLAAKYFYPKIYRLNSKELAVYDLGCQCAKELGCSNISHFPFKLLCNDRIGEIREMLNIDMAILEKYRQKESLLLSGS